MTSTLLFAAISCVLVVNVFSQWMIPGICPLNEEFVGCVNRCDKCEDRYGGCFQDQVCIPGCNCIDGFYRNSGGFCIPEILCEDEFCLRPGEVYKSCGSPCEATCNSLRFRIGIRCLKRCKPGCFCRDGLVRDSKNDCVDPSQCQNSTICNIPLCKAGCEIKQVPNQPCPQCVCDKYSTGTICNIPLCKAGCEIKQVPNQPCPQCVCDKNLTGPICHLPLCKEGCQIVKVPNQPCPKCVCDKNSTVNCGPDEEYYQCKPFCINRCKPIKICPRICLKGCYCKKGLVLNDDGKCVRKDECNQKPPGDKICKKDEQFYPCKPTCNNTCENYGKNGPCPLICSSGCYCMKGLVLRNDGKCVKPDQCKKECPKPKCLSSCYLDRNNKPCPRCVCTKVPVCPRIACPAYCHFETINGCPRCVCNENSNNTNDESEENEDDENSEEDETNSNMDDSDEDNNNDDNMEDDEGDYLEDEEDENDGEETENSDEMSSTDESGENEEDDENSVEDESNSNMDDSDEDNNNDDNMEDDKGDYLEDEEDENDGEETENSDEMSSEDMD